MDKELYNLIMDSPTLSDIGKEILLYLISKDKELGSKLEGVFIEEREEIDKLKSIYEKSLESINDTYKNDTKTAYINSIKQLFDKQQKRIQDIVNEEHKETIDADGLLSQI